MLLLATLAAIAPAVETGEVPVYGHVTAEGVGPISAATLFSETVWRRMFPKARITPGYCFPSDIPLRETDAVEVDLGSRALLRICHNDVGRLSHVFVGKGFTGYRGLRVGDRWRPDVFDKTECRPEPTFWTLGTFNRVTCRRSSKENVGYEFTVPTFAYGTREPQVIDYEAGVLSSMSWTAPRMPER